MTDMHDDAARQIVHQLRARMFTETLSGCPATPSRYIETAERIAPVLDVQAAPRRRARRRGRDPHLGDVALTPAGAAALRDHLGELLPCSATATATAGTRRTLRTRRPMTRTRSADGAVRPVSGSADIERPPGPG